MAEAAPAVNPFQRCQNLSPDEKGEYIDLFTFEPIEVQRLVHLPYSRGVYCYDALFTQTLCFSTTGR